MVKHKHFVFTMLIASIGSTALSQSTCLTTGGDASSADGSVSFSIGQIDYVSNNNSSGLVHQGVQQPYELFEIIGVTEIGNLINMSIFPNPASHHVMVMVNGTFTDLNLELYDAIGKLISIQPIYSMQTQLSLSELRNGIYFIKLRDAQGTEKGSLKLIKTQ
jgi:Secretion system C-terminal sorting domain